MLHLIIPIEPEGKREARRNRNGQVFKHPATRISMNLIADHVKRQFQGEPLDEPIRIEIHCYRTRPISCPTREYAATKPDYDNIAKLVGDALEGVLWVNDSRIVDARIIKRYAPTGASGWIEIMVTRCVDAAV